MQTRSRVGLSERRIFSMAPAHFARGRNLSVYYVNLQRDILREKSARVCAPSCSSLPSYPHTFVQFNFFPFQNSYVPEEFARQSLRQFARRKMQIFFLHLFLLSLPFDFYIRTGAFSCTLRNDHPPPPTPPYL